MTNEPHTSSTQGPEGTLTVLVVPEDSTEPIRVETIEPSTEAITRILNAWLIQAVEAPGWCAWVDESGMVHGRAVNVRATHLARHLGAAQDLSFGAAVLHGPAVFCGEEVGDGVQTDVTDDVVIAANVVDALVKQAAGTS